MKRLSKSSFDEDAEREHRILYDRKNRGRDSDKENRSDIGNTKKERAGRSILGIDKIFVSAIILAFQ